MASRRSAPSGHVATTTTTQKWGSLFTWPRGPFSACHFHPGPRPRAAGAGGPPLRGSASHEAEGRRGARAGRVRAPTGRRLCVLRQIGDQLILGLEEFLFVDDVVAVEDGAGLVAGQEHGDPLGDAGADQVAGGGAAAIVEEAGRHPGRLAGSQAEGFLHALFGMMRLDLSAPDYTTLSRRSQHLRRRLRPVPTDEGLHLVLDSTDLSIVGAGEWAAAKHGGCGRRGWRKLHLGVDQSGVILVHTLTEATGDDATTALDLLTAVEGPLVRVTADAAYDTVAVYETAGARGATVVIPPARTATVSGDGPRSPARDRTITLVKQLGRRQWKQASGYHRQGRVENTFFRYKSIIGDGLRARSPAGQGSEVVLGCEILNRMTALGRPVSYRIGR